MPEKAEYLLISTSTLCILELKLCTFSISKFIQVFK